MYCVIEILENFILKKHLYGALKMIIDHKYLTNE